MEMFRRKPLGLVWALLLCVLVSGCAHVQGCDRPAAASAAPARPGTTPAVPMIAPTPPGSVPASAPHNVILMIGDGMGVAQVTAAKVVEGDLAMERLPVGGLATTWPENGLVTDSAASGTALATGRKTLVGSISVAPSGERLETVLEKAEILGKATGLVVTCSITHATPAAFVSHVASREDDIEIARQIAESDVDVLFGGGLSFFLPRSESGGAREDGANLIEALRGRMAVALSPEEFRALGDVDRAAALFAPVHPPAVETREPALTELTEKALEILSRDEDGFFLMIEGSQIDWASHEKQCGWLVDETVDFDRAVGVVMDFAQTDGATLVVVTADHETGGYALLGGSLKGRTITSARFACDEHTATMVPVLAYGPGADAFGGITDNAAVGRALIEAVLGGR